MVATNGGVLILPLIIHGVTRLVLVHWTTPPPPPHRTHAFMTHRVTVIMCVYFMQVFHAFLFPVAAVELAFPFPYLPLPFGRANTACVTYI